MSYPGWIDDVDYEAPTSCGHCGESIRESDMNAGYYATRDNHETTLHVGDCAKSFDAENPGRRGEDDRPGEQWPVECATCGVERTPDNASGHDWI